MCGQLTLAKSSQLLQSRFFEAKRLSTRAPYLLRIVFVTCENGRV